MANRLRNANIVGLTSNASAIDHNNHRLIIHLMHSECVFMTVTPRVEYLAGGFKFNHKTCGITYGTRIGHISRYLNVVLKHNSNLKYSCDEAPIEPCTL